MFRLSTRGLILAGATLAVALVALPASNAETSFDGDWSISFVTKSGPCLQSYSGTGQIINRVIYFTGTGSFSGRVAPSGSVSMRFSVGPGHAVGVGELSSDSGRGTWHADVMEVGACSGVLERAARLNAPAQFTVAANKNPRARALGFCLPSLREARSEAVIDAAAEQVGVERYVLRGARRRRCRS